MEFAGHVAVPPAHGPITPRGPRSETRLDEFISSFPLVVLCRYDAQQFAADAGGSGAAAVWSVAVDSNGVSRWFGEYLDAFAACGRGESDTASLLGYYGVPLLLTTGGGFFAATSDDQVVAAVQQQVDGMRAAAYSRSEILDSEVTVLNSTSALYRGTFSRQRSDGSEISQLTATYLVTDGAAGRRISVLAVHGP